MGEMPAIECGAQWERDKIEPIQYLLQYVHEARNDKRRKKLRTQYPNSKCNYWDAAAAGYRLHCDTDCSSGNCRSYRCCGESIKYHRLHSFHIFFFYARLRGRRQLVNSPNMYCTVHIRVQSMTGKEKLYGRYVACQRPVPGFYFQCVHVVPSFAHYLIRASYTISQKYRRRNCLNIYGRGESRDLNSATTAAVPSRP